MIEVGDVLRKGEPPADAVERLRHRLRELDADRHWIESSCVPSSDCKARMRGEIETTAASGAPSLEGLIEHFGDIAWPQHVVHIPPFAMGEKGAAVTGSASGELTDVMALMIWLHKSAVSKVIRTRCRRKIAKCALPRSGATGGASSEGKPNCAGARRPRAQRLCTARILIRAPCWALN
ncbi:hypothetical protein [Bradyrhizobium sp. NAS80.1]|uniref:hypothetical protein n=1 Tax=Bradyrhizobium sp. NAS80.1 TaxID=1680159 RepID=UPI00116143F1|nr:hypothetical protein [Bradyrhizobium sp. NAS80.1]